MISKFFPVSSGLPCLSCRVLSLSKGAKSKGALSKGALGGEFFKPEIRHRNDAIEHFVKFTGLPPPADDAGTTERMFSIARLQLMFPLYIEKIVNSGYLKRPDRKFCTPRTARNTRGRIDRNPAARNGRAPASMSTAGTM